MTLRTEDQVRDYAKLVLGFDEAEENVDQGTGQITTFNQLGFKGYSDKLDGWYLAKNMNDVAIILETKSEEREMNKEDLKRAANITSNIVSRMSKNSYVNLESLEKICLALDCRIEYVIEISKSKQV